MKGVAQSQRKVKLDLIELPSLTSLARALVSLEKTP